MANANPDRISRSAFKQNNDLDDPLIECSSEIITGRLYFVVLRSFTVPKHSSNLHYFTVDEIAKYDPFYDDFGPLNLAQVHHFCVKLKTKFESYVLSEKKIIYYTTINPEKRVNAAFLIGSYAILYLRMSPNEVFQRLTSAGYPYLDFRDASQGVPVYTISLLDCLNAIYTARKLNFYNPNDFSVKDYEHYETVENGDLNWIVPAKLVALAGPTCRMSLYSTHKPEAYLTYFNEHKITTVVRLNNKLYDRTRFTAKGIHHFDLFFLDGTTPKDHQVDKFLKYTEESKGAVAVHCKAGLGRTGCMIACYIMKWYHFTAREAIAWLRICRPASIIGYQQEWLEGKEKDLWAAGKGLIAPRHRVGIYSLTTSDKGNLIKRVSRINQNRIAFTPCPSNTDTVSRITDRVTEMKIDSATNDANRNSNEEQGDRLNRIKLNRQIARSNMKNARSSWPINTVSSSGKRISSVGRLMAHKKNSARFRITSTENKAVADVSIQQNTPHLVVSANDNPTTKSIAKQTRKTVR